MQTFKKFQQINFKEDFAIFEIEQKTQPPKISSVYV